MSRREQVLAFRSQPGVGGGAEQSGGKKRRKQDQGPRAAFVLDPRTPLQGVREERPPSQEKFSFSIWLQPLISNSPKFLLTSDVQSM